MDSVTFRTARMETGQLIIDIPPDQRGAVMRFLRTKKDRAYDLTIKEHRKKRSLDANAYFWELVGQLADALRITPKEIYRQAIQDIGGNYEIIPVKKEAVSKFKEAWEKNGLGWPCVDMGPSKIPGYRNLKAYYGSSTYDTRQMSMLIDHIVQDCKAVGLDTKSKEELDSLLERGNEKRHKGPVDTYGSQTGGGSAGQPGGLALLHQLRRTGSR